MQVYIAYFSSMMNPKLFVILKLPLELPFFASLCNFQRTIKMVEMSGIEPLTPCLQGRCSPS
jgi:hypothetical protein